MDFNKQFVFDDNTPMDWMSLGRRDIQDYSKKELESAVGYIWRNNSKIKADILHPYATMVSLEIEKRNNVEATKRNEKSIALSNKSLRVAVCSIRISFVVLILTIFSVGIGYYQNSKSINLAVDDAKGDKVWLESQITAISNVSTVLEKILLIKEKDSQKSDQAINEILGELKNLSSVIRKKSESNK